MTTKIILFLIIILTLIGTYSFYMYFFIKPIEICGKDKICLFIDSSSKQPYLYINGEKRVFSNLTPALLKNILSETKNKDEILIKLFSSLNTITKFPCKNYKNLNEKTETVSSTNCSLENCPENNLCIGINDSEKIVLKTKDQVILEADSLSLLIDKIDLRNFFINLPISTYTWNAEWDQCDPNIGKQTRGWTGINGPLQPQIKDCTVDCVQGDIIYDDCDKNTGKRLKSKTILIPPQNGGQNCEEPIIEKCPVDCEVKIKDDFEPCDTTLGLQTRKYDVVVTPKNGGQDCPPYETRPCDIVF